MQLQTYELKNSSGMQIEILNYGGIITKWIVPDRQGNFSDIVLGFDDVSEFTSIDHPYFNALIGRYANRIAGGKFNIGFKSYKLAINNGPSSLHGGLKGFDKVFWNVEELKSSNALRLTYTSADGEEGYPGNLKVCVLYTLTEDNEWRIDYQAETDQPTIINLTQHAYFNLNLSQKKTILDHEVEIAADQMTAVNENLVPTGEIINVKNTVFDLNNRQPVKARIAEIPQGKGYDHNYILRPAKKAGTIRLAAKVFDAPSGRELTVSTDQPGIQFYTGNFLDGAIQGKSGWNYIQHAGFCLETQHFPDSPHHKNFPSTVLEPGEIYKSTTIYKLNVLI